jgi:hypothetical protein
LIHRRATISQKLPKEYEEKLINLQKYVISFRKKHFYLLSQIGNADQSPVRFDMSQPMTTEYVGVRSI